MKKLSGVILLAVLGTAPSFSVLATGTQTGTVAKADIDATNPYTLINQVSHNAFARIKKDHQTFQQNPELLRAVAEEELLPHINVKYAAYKVLGREANKATKAQRDQFVKAFTDYLIAAYAQIMTQYTNQEINVESPSPIDPKRKVVGVRVEILDSARPPIRLDFKLRKNSKSGEWQGYDVDVEGVSMLNTKQSEWSTQLRKNGILAVANQLEELAKQPISAKEAIK
ncbi:phospholipid-binding protein MlaC [Veronia nyctiphanis]|uniref:phospholipid-binding protein MlaC n=1 Tax=Veronia nyctiphanis TaxID=1278244 RepID=UPI0038B58523